MDISSRILFRHPHEPCLGVFCPRRRSSRSGRPMTALPMCRHRVFRQSFRGNGKEAGRPAVDFPSAPAASFRIPLRVWGSAGAFTSLGGFVYFLILIFPTVSSDSSPPASDLAVTRAPGPLRCHPCPRPQLRSLPPVLRGTKVGGGGRKFRVFWVIMREVAEEGTFPFASSTKK